MIINIGNELLDIEGVVFDMDGTILDSMAMWERMAGVFLGKYGYAADKKIEKIFLTGTCEEIAKCILENYPINTSVEKLENSINEMIENAYAYQIPLKEGAYNVISKLHENEVKVAIATATDRYLVEAMCRRTGIDSLIDVIMTCKEAGAGKNSPDIYDEAVGRMGLSKESTVIVEDALYAIKTAKKAGYRVIGIYEDAMKEDWQEIMETADEYRYSLENGEKI